MFCEKYTLKILVTADYFYPSIRASGPIRSLVNFVQKFSSIHELFVLTRDRDPNASEAYPDIVAKQWNEVLGIQARYVSPSENLGQVIRETIRSVGPDTIYMNSLMSPLTRSVLRFACRQGTATPDLLLAVRGELSPGALAIKPIRKRIFLQSGKVLGLFKGVRFQASSADEVRFIEHWFPDNKIHTAMDIPSEVIGQPKTRPSGDCRFVFNSRIAPIKNLEIAISAFESLNASHRGFEGILEIHGSPTDQEYLAKILRLLGRCGSHGRHCGPYRHDQIWDILGDASFSILPSRGENFAHAIYESAAAGVPFLISDRTPWTAAAHNGCGWVIDPDDLDGWKNAIINAINMSQDDYLRASEKCIEAAREMQSRAHHQHEALFLS